MPEPNHDPDATTAVPGEQLVALLTISDGRSTVTRPAECPTLGGLQAVAGYDLLEVIGRGGMGIVYRARDTQLNRDVAVKLLQRQFLTDASDVERFRDEARITGQLQHPGIPPIHQVGELPDGGPFLVMKLIQGRTLADILASRERGCPELDLIPVFERVCQAVGYAHSRDIIHRDLKPANVMVGAFGEVQVMDWGLARTLAGHERQRRGEGQPGAPTTGTPSQHTLAPGSAARTVPGTVMGTPEFMSPEQACGATEQVDAQSDVFGLGGILCVILTGEPPFVGHDAQTTLQMAAARQLGPAYERLDACSADPELVALCKRCLDAEHDRRPADGGEVAAAIGALRTAAEERARLAEQRRAATEARAIEQRKRRRVQFALAAAVGFILLAGAAVAWWQDRQKAERHRKEELAASEKREALRAMIERCENALRGHDAYTAGLAWAEVEKHLREGGSEDFEVRVNRCRVDLTMLKELDQIDSFRWIRVDGDLPKRPTTSARWETAFADFGIVPGTTTPTEAARLLNESLILERLLTALDLWLLFGSPPSLAGVLEAIDPDPYRTAVRAAVSTRDSKRLLALAAEPAALQQPARFAVALGQNRVLTPERRRVVLERAAMLRPGDLSILTSLDYTYRINQARGAAERLRWSQAAVAAHPRNVGAYNNLGLALKDKGDVDGAIAAYRAGLRIDPEAALLYYNLGTALHSKELLHEAIAEYDRSIRYDPNFAPAYNNRGAAWDQLGKVDQAVADYNTAIKYRADYPHAYCNLGIFLFNQNKLDEAIRCFDKAIRDAYEQEFPFPLPHYYRGLALSAKGDLDGAIAAHQAAVQAEPGNPLWRQGRDDALRQKLERDGRIAPLPREVKR